ncbi:MAG TPA: DMT family transporter [Solirubrobacterales bacterium]|nr:DMT family transporter [Solirubrobacterales bacterium]
MLAIVGGLGAALVFATVTLCNSRSTRLIGPAQLLAWVMLIGLAITAPLAFARGIPDGLDAEAAAWMAVAGVGNVAGLLLAYSALRLGKVGVVAPLVSTQGAIAAVIAIVGGEQVGTEVAILLAVIAIGIWLAAVASPEEPDGSPRQDKRAAMFAIGAAVAIGWSLYAIAQVSIALPVVWALLPSRVIGVLVVTLPLAARSGLRMTREALPLVLVAGVFEVAGFALFAFGARHGIAVSAVLSSQFAAIAAIAAYILFRERLSPVQLAGVAVIVAGVGTLSGVQA